MYKRQLTANNPCQTSATATSNSIQVKVNASPAVLPINTGTVNITTASLCTLGSTVRYYDNTPYGTWSSSNPAVASVSSTGSGGNVTANTNGTETITYSLSLIHI